MAQETAAEQKLEDAEAIELRLGTVRMARVVSPRAQGLAKTLRARPPVACLWEPLCDDPTTPKTQIRISRSPPGLDETEHELGCWVGRCSA